MFRFPRHAVPVHLGKEGIDIGAVVDVLRGRGVEAQGGEVLHLHAVLRRLLLVHGLDLGQVLQGAVIHVGLHVPGVGQIQDLADAHVKAQGGGHGDQHHGG